jgi:hypothetical protein
MRLPPPGAPRGPLLVPVVPPPLPPPQDHDAIDEIERSSRMFTLAVAMIAGVLAILLLIAILIRVAQ